MTSYAGRHAELFDVFYADKPYSGEAAFVHHYLQRYGTGKVERLLDLACGTGSHSMALTKYGYRIAATDYSPDMLSCARRKASSQASIKFYEQDMRALALPDGPYDAAICLFDSIGYVQTNEAITQVLNGVHRHLRPGGVFVFEFWHAAAMLAHYEPVRVRRWETPDGELLRISETRLSHPQQTATVHYSIYELHRDGTYQVIREAQTNRYFQVQEMAQFLSSCGFQPLKWFSGFSEEERISDSAWHVVAVARRQ